MPGATLSLMNLNKVTSSSELEGWRKADDFSLLNKNVAKFTEVKTGWANSRQVWQNILRKVMDQKGLFVL